MFTTEGDIFGEIVAIDVINIGKTISSNIGDMRKLIKVCKKI